MRPTQNNQQTKKRRACLNDIYASSLCGKDLFDFCVHQSFIQRSFDVDLLITFLEMQSVEVSLSSHVITYMNTYVHVDDFSLQTSVTRRSDEYQSSAITFTMQYRWELGTCKDSAFVKSLANV
jgi:hypothetical protein